ncbi:predicted protein [Coccidioides posadasii str. Silveira]|uniref:Predicted protein n=1 Tax=Coccidioides posadasii (strain RMSCC 757 / Silveira) TaxID=443226 RepID=E9D8T3_COCPS|nr:predicted protein [Coccidioides posadasii str. Silveira]
MTSLAKAQGFRRFGKIRKEETLVCASSPNDSQGSCRTGERALSTIMVTQYLPIREYR